MIMILCLPFFNNVCKINYILRSGGNAMYLVFDVGGTFIKYAWMTSDGQINEKGKMPTPCQVGDSIDDFINVVTDVYKKYAETGNVDGIAMGLPGQIDVDRGIVYGGGALKYLDEIALGQLLSEHCDGVRVSLENDAKCAALAEVWMGNAKDVKNACVMVFGTGVGGGIIIDGKVHHGSRMLAGEISYFMDNMTREDLENIKSVEKLPLYEAIDTNYFIMSSVVSTSALTYHVSKLKKMKPEEVKGEMIFQWVREGDKEVKEILEEFYFKIAKMCCSLYVTIDPDVILLGGGISAEPAFIEGIRKYVDKLKKITKVFNGIRLDVCKYQNDSNLYGALYNFKQKYEVK